MSSCVSSPTSRISVTRTEWRSSAMRIGRRVAQPVVEEADVEPIDGGVDEQVVDVGELADHANAAARDGGRERRQARLERADVRIERRVGDVERQLGVHLGRQRDAAGARDGKARRGRLELERHHVAVDVDVADDLADAFVGDEEVTDRPAHVVARHVEGAAAAGREVDQARQRHAVPDCASAMLSTEMSRASKLNE